jgi:hypothetical protein
MHASCLCGDVSWDVEGPFELAHHCHCGRCRKAHGTAFATFAGAPLASFRMQGREHVARYASSPGLSRCFCRRCGSVVPGGEGVDGQVFVPVGSFTDAPGVRPLAHIFVASKAPWYAIADGLPRFDAYPPGFGASVLPDRPPVDPPGGVRGSCLCGGVAWRLVGDPILCRNCHCGRCRRGRSAAHASNLGVRLEDFRWTRGEELVASYEVPEARFFTQAFCSVCGGKVPRLDPGRGIAVVPLGSLDDDPGVRPTEHIFVASKAPWFEIADALPQHAEYGPG